MDFNHIFSHIVKQFLISRNRMPNIIKKNPISGIHIGNCFLISENNSWYWRIISDIQKSNWELIYPHKIMKRIFLISKINFLISKNNFWYKKIEYPKPRNRHIFRYQKIKLNFRYEKMDFGYEQIGVYSDIQKLASEIKSSVLNIGKWIYDIEKSFFYISPIFR